MFEFLRSAAAPSKSDYGDESLNDDTLEETGLLDDLKAMGPNLGENILALVEKAFAEGKPIDDKTMLVRSDNPLMRKNR